MKTKILLSLILLGGLAVPALAQREVPLDFPEPPSGDIVRKIDADGDHLVYAYSSTKASTFVGHILFYSRENGVWKLKTDLDLTTDLDFGMKLSASGGDQRVLNVAIDEDVAVLSVDKPAQVPQAGAFYLFKRDHLTGEWTNTGGNSLNYDGSGTSAQLSNYGFGTSLAINRQSNTLAVGSPHYTYPVHTLTARSGLVALYELNEQGGIAGHMTNVWAFESNLLPVSHQYQTSFGEHIALYADESGNSYLVASSFYYSFVQFVLPIYRNFFTIFDLNNNKEQVASDYLSQNLAIFTSPAGDKMMDVEGRYLAIKGGLNDEANNKETVIIYDLSGGKLNKDEKVTLTAPSNNEGFGTHLDLQSVGKDEGIKYYLGVSAPYGDAGGNASSDEGTVYVYQAIGKKPWSKEYMLSIHPDKGKSDDLFGKEFTLSRSGLVGMENSGRSYFFDFAPAPPIVDASDDQKGLDNKIQISWQDGNNSEVNEFRTSSYTLYDQDGTQITESDVPQPYTDKSVNPGEVRSYSVVAANPFGSSAPAYDAGRAIPAGKISGFVRAPQENGGGGLGGVRIDMAVTGAALELNTGTVAEQDRDENYLIAKDIQHFPDDAITAEFWARPESSDNKIMISYDGKDVSNGFLVGTSNNLLWIYVAGSGFVSNVTVPENEWNHYAVSWESETGALKIYRNGEEQQTATLAKGGAMPADGTLIIGQDQDCLGGCLDYKQSYIGQIDELRIWNIAREPEAIAETFKALVNPADFAKDLALYYRFDQGDSQSAMVYDLMSAPREDDGGAPLLRKGKSGFSDGAPGLHMFDYTEGAEGISGAYALENILLDDEGGTTTFTVAPYNDGTRGFIPESKTVMLTAEEPAEDGVNFEDTSYFKIDGAVYYDLTTKNYPGKGIAIMVYTQKEETLVDSIQTDSEGHFAITLQPGNYEIKPEYEGHTFSPAEYKLNIPDGIIDSLIFENTTRYTISGKFVGGSCDINMGKATLDVTCCGNEVLAAGIETQENQEGLNKYSVEVPALVDDSIRLEIVGLDNNELNLELAKTGEQGFLQAEQYVNVEKGDAAVNFFYRNDPQLKINVSGLTPLECAEDLYLLTEEDKVTLEFEAYEMYGDQICKLDTGSFIIYDDISDRADSVMFIEKADSVYQYTLSAGNPNLIGGGSHPYQKSMQVVLDVPLGKSTTQTLWSVVTGTTPRVGQPFTTVRPSNIPLMVLRDPPGDQSYSFLSEGTTITRNMQISDGGHGSAGLTIKVGEEGETPVHAETSVTLGFEGADTESVEMSMTTNKTISTANDGIPGKSSDLFIGTAINLLYGLSDVLDYNTETCQPSLSQTVNWGPGEIETTYLLSYFDIKNFAIPELKTLIEAEKNSMNDLVRIDSLETAIDDWQRLLNFTDYTSDYMMGTEKENITFTGNAGAYEYSTTISKSATEAYHFTTTFDTEVELGFDVTIPVPFMSMVRVAGTGFSVKAGYNYTESQSETKEDTYGVGYVLDDNDPGDQFSVDVTTQLESNPEFEEDIRTLGMNLVNTPLTNSTPFFKLAGGQSSAPYEGLPSVPRDSAQVIVTPRSQIEVPADEEAVFTLNVGNLSQSGEIRDVAVRLLSGSNPDGAIVTSGSGFLANGILMTSIPANESQTITFTVKRGPNAYRYENLKIIAYSPSEFEQYEEIGLLDLVDTVSFSVYFKAECTAPGFFSPQEGWVVNQASNDSLKVIVQDYDNNAVNSIDLQIRKLPVGSWTTLKVLTAQDLTSNYSTQFLNVANFDDGRYELRAVSECEGGKNYSEVLEGMIDRGAPEIVSRLPVDNVLGPDETISVFFNEDIDPSTVRPDNLLLINMASGDTLDIDLANDERRIFITPQEDYQIMENADMQLIVRGVSDIYENVAPPNNWFFVVNQNPIAWEIPRVIEYMSEGEAFTFDARLHNGGTEEAPLSFSDLPDWLTLLTTETNIPGQASMFISFKVKEGAILPTGRYEETIALETEYGTENLDIILNVSCPLPDWEINPAEFKYAMVVNAGIYAEELSFAEPNDRLAAFVGDELRGVSEVFKLIPDDEFVAFLTVYSNSPSGEEVSFQLWDASECEILPALETIAFENNATEGDAKALKKLTLGNAQLLSIPLSAGVNWISFNLDQHDMSPNHLIKGIGLGDGDIISAMDSEYAQFVSFQGWKGTLDTLKPGVSYKLLLKNSATLYVKGSPAVEGIKISHGWNPYGYIGQDPKPIDEALVDYDEQEGDIIRSQEASASFTNGIWQGTLQNLEPGKGYYLYSQGGNTTFARIAQHHAQMSKNAAADFKVNPAGYANYMNITATLELDGIQYSESDIIIGAFVDGVCRGVAAPMAVLDRWVYFLTVYGESQEDTLTFKAYRQSNDQLLALSQSLVFDPEGVEGELRAPFILSKTAQEVLETENRAPEGIILSANGVLAGQPAGEAVGILAARDPNIGDTHTFTLVPGEGSDDNDLFTIQGQELVTNATFTFDPDGDNEYSIRAQAEDGRGGAVSKVFLINTINASNHVPSEIRLSKSQILYGQDAGAAVGTLSTEDEDNFDKHAYELISVDKDALSNLFRIEGDLLLANITFTKDMVGIYKVVIASADGQGGRIERTFDVEVTDKITGLKTDFGHKFSLGNFTPNPVSDRGGFNYSLATRGSVSISIIDMMGKVWKQIDKEHQAPGLYRITMDMTDLPNGVYIYRIETADGSKSKRLVRY